jgi:hypothetical protein
MGADSARVPDVARIGVRTRRQVPSFPPVTGGAAFSADGRYRYRLWRRWDRSRPVVAFVMLNPSTADARRDDPTIRRCVAFARRWGYGGIEVVNLFALRATDPRALQAADDPIGPVNDRHVRRALAAARTLVLAWGARGAMRDRAASTRRLVSPRAPRCLGLTRSGEPRHPLYLRSDARLVLVRSARRSAA